MYSKQKTVVFSKMQEGSIQAIEQLAARHGGTKSNMIDYLVRVALEQAYSAGLRVLAVKELKERHQGKRYEPEKLMSIVEEMSSWYEFDDILDAGFTQIKLQRGH
jgi:hypothetical protein